MPHKDHPPGGSGRACRRWQDVAMVRLPGWPPRFRGGRGEPSRGAAPSQSAPDQVEMVPKLFQTPGVPPVTQTQPTVPPAAGELFQMTSPFAHSPLVGTEVPTPW